MEKVSYREVINPPISWMAFILFLYLSMALAVWAAFDTNSALATLGLLVATLPFLWRALRMVITIDDELRVDRAHIELQFIQEVNPVDAKEYQALRRANFDARSFHATRPWVKAGVKVAIEDERDPTNYWLIGSKRTSELADALIKRSRDR